MVFCACLLPCVNMPSVFSSCHSLFIQYAARAAANSGSQSEGRIIRMKKAAKRAIFYLCNRDSMILIFNGEVIV